MSNNMKYNKTNFVRLTMATIEEDSLNTEKSMEYLSSQGLNPDSIISDGLKRIKKIQLQINAEKTRTEMVSIEDLKIKAIKVVEDLLSNVNFSFTEFVKHEGLAMSFRNMESLGEEDIKDLLIKHFTLKLLEDQKKK